MEIEDGDVPPPARLDAFEESAWPTFAIQTAQDDLRVRASQRDAKRAGVEEQRARKAARLRKNYERKIERVRLFKSSQERLKRKVRDLNVRHARERGQLRKHLSSLRSKGIAGLSSTGSGSFSPSVSATVAGQSSSCDTLSLLKQSLESSLGLDVTSIGASQSLEKALRTPHQTLRFRGR